MKRTMAKPKSKNEEEDGEEEGKEEEDEDKKDDTKEDKKVEEEDKNVIAILTNSNSNNETTSYFPLNTNPLLSLNGSKLNFVCRTCLSLLLYFYTLLSFWGTETGITNELFCGLDCLHPVNGSKT